MKKFVPVLLAVITLAAVGFGALARVQVNPGDVLNVQATTAQLGYSLAQMGAPGTARFISPDGSMLLWSWPCSGAQAWAWMAADDAALGKFVSGNLATIEDWAGMQALVLRLGWRSVTAAEFSRSGALLSVLQSVAIISKGMMTPILVPAGMFFNISPVQA